MSRAKQVSGSFVIARVAFGVLPFIACAGCATDPSAEGRVLVTHGSDYDPDRALLTLEQILPDPPAPAAPESSPSSLEGPTLRRLARASELYGRRRFTEAALELEKALRREPNNPQLHRELAKTHYAAGSFERVRSHLQKVVTLGSADIVTHYLLGRLAYEDRETTEAIRHYRVALKGARAGESAPFVALTHFRLAQALNADHYLTAAIEQYRAYERAVLSLPPDAPQEPELVGLLQINGGNAGEPISVAYEKLGEFGAAADALAAALADRRVDGDAMERLARLLARSGRFEEALERARSLMEETDRGVQLVVDIHERAGHPEQAVDDVRALYEAKPERPHLAVVYVDVLLRFGRLADAERVLTEGLVRHAGAHELRWRLCDVLTKEKKWSRVLEVAADALRADPDDHHAARGKVLAMAGDGDAITMLLGREESRAQSVSDPTAAYLLGCLAGQVGRSDQAESFLASALDDRPRLTPARVQLATILLDRFAWQAVIDLATAEPDELAGSARLQALCGQAYAGLDDFGRAESHLSAAVGLDRTDIDAAVALAQLLRDKGEILRAGRQFEAVIEMNPLHEASREALFEIHLFEQEDRRQDAAGQLAELRRLSASPHRIARCAARLDLDPRAADWGKYRKTLQDAIDRNGPDARTYELLGQSYLLTDMPEEALAAFDRAIELDPDDDDIAMGRVLAFRALLDYDRQIEALGVLLTRHPNRQMWNQSMLEALLIDHRFDEALAWSLRRLKRPGLSDQEVSVYRDGVREALSLTRRTDELIAYLKSWRDEDRGNRRLSEVLIATYGLFDHHDEAVSEAEAFYDREPSSETRKLLWRTLVAAERYERAERFLLRLLEDDPDDDYLNDRLVRTLEFADRPDDALELLDNEVYGSRSPLAVRQDKLNVLERAGRYEEAVKLWSKWVRDVEANPHEVGVDVNGLRMGVANAQFQAGEVDEAVISLGNWKDEVDSPLAKFEFLTRLSTYHQLLGESDKALELLGEAYELRDSTLPEAFARRNLPSGRRVLDSILFGVHNDYGYSLADAGVRLDDAERMIRHALARQPRSEAYLDSYGWVLYKKGDFAQAKRWLMKAATASVGGDPVIYDHLGDALWRSGEADEAVARWTKTVELATERLSKGPERADLRTLLTTASAKIERVQDGVPPNVAPIVKSNVETP